MTQIIKSSTKKVTADSSASMDFIILNISNLNIFKKTEEICERQKEIKDLYQYFKETFTNLWHMFITLDQKSLDVNYVLYVMHSYLSITYQLLSDFSGLKRIVGRPSGKSIKELKLEIFEKKID